MKEMNGIVCHNKILINKGRYPNVEELIPKELFFLPTGAVGDLPSFAIAMTNFSAKRSAIGQFSLETLKAALNDVGFDIVKLNKSTD